MATTKLINQARKVRVVAKIRGFTDLESRSSVKPSISVGKPNSVETVTISFGDQSASCKQSYELDYCYEQNESNDIIFQRELKPLISGVFNGRNATVIAYGARGSGKTYSFQGSEEEPGLLLLAMSQVFSVADEKGKSISISYYEILQDNVYDLLDPKHPQVSVLTDTQGKIKGLSQVPVKSLSEYQQLNIGQLSYSKTVSKTGLEVPQRSHKGLVVHLSPECDKLDPRCGGKLNFVDLAGYEDGRRKSIDGYDVAENIRINKTIHALQNVASSLNHGESHVPYRDSKLTHLLRDSLSANCKILFIACLNPLFCRDSIYIANLASRICRGANRVVSESIKRTSQGTNRVGSESTKKINFSARPTIISSQTRQLRGNVSAKVKSHTTSRSQLPEKKPNKVVSAIKARKLFDETSCLAKPKKESGKASSSSDDVRTAKLLLSKEESSSSVDVLTTKPLLNEEETMHLSPVDTQDPNPSPQKENLIHVVKDYEQVNPILCTDISGLGFVTREGENPEKENESPPISVRLQELSNNLKMLFSSTPSYTKMNLKDDYQTPIDVVEPKTPPHSFDVIEPKTPPHSFDVIEPKTPPRNAKVDEKSNVCPWERFSACSAGVKNSLAKECVNIFNSANKEELKKFKGIGEKRATYILQLREDSPEPFKCLDDLKNIGLSAKQIKEMMKREVGVLFD